MLEDLHKRQDISLDQQLALRRSAARLATEYDRVFGPETIERFLHSSYEEFAATSSVPNFLPLLAERFARQRLQALARIEGKAYDGTPIVLFLCVHNAGRSQMALGFFEKHEGRPRGRLVRWLGTCSRSQPLGRRRHG